MTEIDRSSWGFKIQNVAVSLFVFGLVGSAVVLFTPDSLVIGQNGVEKLKEQRKAAKSLKEAFSRHVNENHKEVADVVRYLCYGAVPKDWAQGAVNN